MEKDFKKYGNVKVFEVSEQSSKLVIEGFTNTIQNSCDCLGKFQELSNHKKVKILNLGETLTIELC